ncbi:FtsX-like permease family protein [Corynebacterium macginleyi]|uniref:ABC transporter permease n=1 Tax=Corynebacterium macginleyi TaxID=38290 RepID=A0ABS1Y7X9_9CORY|nr:ABC transporter permease [Corynebacterium macginleyi]MBK4140357.1 FtsX-like permease family protein [Corynebacterium macginleyi]MBK4143166.1 FtsX-like permease family protein [Corynebacterium macginleyi]MBK4161005.1 FtsX-like permease family protein [Corynebacterium macginleyi]MBK4166318.1 FtsX-like permease family protein [Corynebacterium macginleyi]MBK4180076.1 FtsX-like permease family protein [Corynebacterium macginleyi]
MARGKAMRRVSVRNIVAHKLRLVLTILAVVLGTAFIAGSFMFTNSLKATFDSVVDNQFRGVDAVVSENDDGNQKLDEGLRQRLLNDPEVKNINVADSQTVVVADENLEAFQTRSGAARLAAYYSTDNTVGGVSELTEGKEPNATGEVTINSSAAEKYDISVGQTLLVVHPDSQDEVRVTGIVKSPVEQGDNIDLHMAEADYLQRFGDPSQLKVSAADGVDAIRFVDDLNDKFDIKAESGERLAEQTSKTMTEALKFVNYFLVAFGMIALLVGTFIIANTFSMIVAQRIKEFALLRALGASRRQITNSVVVESVIVGLLGSLVGVVAGVGLVAVIKAVMGANGMEIGGGLGLSVSAVVVPLILGTIVTVFSAWSPARRAGAVEPVEAMRTTESASGSSLKVRTIFGAILMTGGIIAAVAGVLSDAETDTRAILVGLGAVGVIIGFFLAGPALSLPLVPTLGRVIGAPFGSIGKLAATNSRRNPRRTAATAFALTLGVALVTSIGMLGQTMKASISDTVDQTITSDYILSGPSSGNFPAPKETGARAAEADGVEKIITVGSAPVAVDGRASLDFGTGGMFTVTVDADPTSMMAMNMVEGDANIAGGFVATEDFAKENGWKVGQSYEVTGSKPGKTAEARLVGTFEPLEIVQNMVVSQDVAEEVAADGEFAVQMVGVLGQEGYNKEDLRQNLENAVKELVVVQVNTGKEYAGQAADFIDQMLAILYGLLALAVIIAVLGIVNTLTLGVIERRQEIGMLRAVGTQRRQIRRMITLESVQISLFGAIMGILIGLGLGWSFIDILNDQGLGGAEIPWTMLVIMLLGSAVVGVIAAVWPSQRAAKTPPLEAIAD